MFLTMATTLLIEDSPVTRSVDFHDLRGNRLISLAVLLKLLE
jgi:hypothetical protein